MTAVKIYWLQYLSRNNPCYCLKIFRHILSIPPYNAIYNELRLVGQKDRREEGMKGGGRKEGS